MKAERTGYPHSRYAFVPVSKVSCHQPEQVNDEELPYLIDIARDSQWLLERGWLSGLGLDWIHTRVQGLLREHGWLTSSGHCREAQVRTALAGFYPAGLLARLGCQTSPGSEDWLTRLLRGSNKAQHPLLHLLIMHLLGVDAETFFAPYLTDEGVDVRWNPVAASTASSIKEARSSTYLPRYPEKRDIYRAQWEKIRSENPGTGKKGLRLLATAAYAWLRRNDRAWLDANSPPQSRPAVLRRSPRRFSTR